MKRKVKQLNNEKKIKFLNCEIDNSAFVHYSQILSYEYKILAENEIAEFDIIETQKGFQVKNMKPIKEKFYN